MIMTGVKLSIASGLNVSMPIVGATPADPYIIKNIDGLGPTDVVNFITDNVDEGGWYRGSRPVARQIVMLVKLNPDYTTSTDVQWLRNILYGFMPAPGTGPVRVSVMNGATEVAYTTGYISKMETLYFVKDPVVQITIDCPGAYLIRPTQVNYNPGGVLPTYVDNPGTAPAGFEAKFIANSSSYWFFMRLGVAWSDTVQQIGIYYPPGFLSGDVMIYNTFSGTRSLKMTRGATTTDMLRYLPVTGTSSDWIQLNGGGGNHFTDDGFNAGWTWNYLKFQPCYWGV